MRVIHSIRGIAVIGATAIALTGIGMGTALADPSSPPSLTTLTGISCPPLFDNGNPGGQAGTLVHDYNATLPANPVACWGDVNPSTGGIGDTITTKASGSGDTACSMARPYGVDAEIAALNLNKTDGSEPCIDFVVADRAPNTTSTKDTFVALAKYALDWEYQESIASDVPASLTTAQLTAIYTCADTQWGQVNGNTSDTTPIVPGIPPAGTGVRDTFLKALGITATSEPCWIVGTTSPPNGIFPVSIADWIAQSTHASSTWNHGTMALGEVNGAQPIVTNSSGQSVINPAWPAILDSILYAVVRNGGTATAPAFPTTPAYEATGLPALFKSTGWICTSNAAQSDLVSYGFTLLGPNCGALTAGD